MARPARASISFSQFHRLGLTLITVLLTGLVTPDSRGQGRPAKEGQKLQKADPLIAFSRRWDSNGDRVNTCDEWKLFMRRIFRKADRNRDNLVRDDEIGDISASDPIFAETSLSYFDVNGDGQIAPMELVERPDPYFVRYDGDKDCRVTAKELEGKPK